jgi:predicted secreted hydrolase
MKSSVALLLAVLAAADYRVALPGYRYEFPRDHFAHPDYRTEWWYWTGNLRSGEGRRFGFELTFFRHAVTRNNTGSNVWDVRDVWLAHLALSDIDGGRFLHEERTSRAGPGLAGADLQQARVWNGNWQVAWTLEPLAHGGAAAQHLQAVAARFRMALDLRPRKPPVIHGVNGVSQKAAGEGRASHYISFTRLAARGEIEIDGRRFAVEGLAWMDHEFFTHQLAPGQVGWDWLSLQFTDGAELMLFRLRREDGAPDPYSAGTFVDARGRAIHLDARQFSLTPGGRTWNRYPIEWTLRAPALGIDVTVTTHLAAQELTGRTRYWEGAVEASGSHAGVGYLEMTGYAAPVRMGE